MSSSRDPSTSSASSFRGAVTHPGSTRQRQPEAALSQASHMTSTLPSRANDPSWPHSSLRDAQPWSSTSRDSSTQHHNHSSYAPRYIDRDDPRHTRADIAAPCCPHQARRRSRSPEAPSTSHASRLAARNAEPAPQTRSVPWKDLRTPDKHPGASASSVVATEGSSSKLSLSKSANTAASKRMATDISKWNRKQAEMHAGDTPATLPSSSSSNSSQLTHTDSHPSSTSATSSSQRQDEVKPSNPPFGSAQGLHPASLDVTQMSQAELVKYDYKDTARIACLLCQRKFKSLDTLHRHQDESQLHRDNLAALETCRRGVLRKLESLGAASSQPAVAADPAAALGGGTSSRPSAPVYRDRASERRAVFGADTPSKPNPAPPKTFQGPRPPAAAVETSHSAPEKPIESDNIGSRLLAKMGWLHGQGLGRTRQGRTDIVETKIYKPGAGLGSSTPSDAASHQAAVRHATGAGVAFAGYLDRAKDRKYSQDAQLFK